MSDSKPRNPLGAVIVFMVLLALRAMLGFEITILICLTLLIYFGK